MKLSTTLKFMNAVKAAGITKFQFDTGLGTHYYNNDHALILLDEAESAVINIRRAFVNDTSPYNDKTMVYVSNLDDIHEVRIGGDYESIMKFIKAYGLSLDSEHLKVLVNIDKTNNYVKPMTGDYHLFKEKTEEEIAKMSPAEKEAYEVEKTEHDRYVAMHGLVGKASAQITV